MSHKKASLLLFLALISFAPALRADISTGVSATSQATVIPDDLQKCLDVYGKSLDSFATNEDLFNFIQTECRTDQDADGIADYFDNCPLVANKEQINVCSTKPRKALCLSSVRDTVIISLSKRKINDTGYEFGFFVYLPEGTSIDNVSASIIPNGNDIENHKLTVTCAKQLPGSNGLIYACTIQGNLSGTENLWISMDYNYAKDSVCTIAFGNSNEIKLSAAKAITNFNNSTNNSGNSVGGACTLTVSGTNTGWLFGVFLLGLPVVVAALGRRGKK